MAKPRNYNNKNYNNNCILSGREDVVLVTLTSYPMLHNVLPGAPFSVDFFYFLYSVDVASCLLALHHFPRRLQHILFGFISPFF